MYPVHSDEGGGAESSTWPSLHSMAPLLSHAVRSDVSIEGKMRRRYWWTPPFKIRAPQIRSVSGTKVVLYGDAKVHRLVNSTWISFRGDVSER